MYPFEDAFIVFPLFLFFSSFFLDQHNLFRVATFSLSSVVALLLIIIGVLTWRETRTASAKTSTPFKYNYNVDDSPHDEHLTEPVIFMELNTRLSDAQTSAPPE